MKKLRVLLIVVMSLSLLLVGCQKNEENTVKVKEEKESKFEKVAELYEEKIKGYKDIEFEIDDALDKNDTCTYEYAFANMNDDDIPELLIGKTSESFEIKYIKLFYYDKENNKLLSPNENIEIGISGMGGLRADLCASNKNNGLILEQGSGMNGKFEILRINLHTKEDGTIALKNTTEKEYMLGDTIEDDGERMIINWYKIDDLSALEQFKLGKLDLTKEVENNKEAEDSKELEDKKEVKEKEEPNETEAVVDNKTIFKGTLKYLSYDEVLELQGIKDPNNGNVDTSKKFALLVFDNEQDVTAESGDGSGPYTNKAKMISLPNFEEASEYNGKEIKVKISVMYWPSDTSLPLGEPFALEGKYEIVK